jgi:glycosyltransferase involved in cell wall biosynthesis
MATLPSIAVIIPAFNAAPFLRRAVESVWATQYPHLQVAIIDDGSRDETVAVARQLCAEAPGRCRLLAHRDEGHHGVSATRNRGLANTDSEWVAFLDGDDSYLPNRFACLTLDAPDLVATDAVYGLTRMHFDVASPPGAAAWWSSTGDDAFGIREPLTDSALLARMLTGVTWHTGAITVRRRLLERTGGFDPDKRIAEDCDLWFRFAAIGKVVPDDLSQPISRYHRHDANTYEYRIEHRVPMVLAMLDAWRWARHTGAPAERLAVFREAVPLYAERAVIAAREAGRPDVAWALLRIMARRAPVPFFMRLGPWKQVRGLWRRKF